MSRTPWATDPATTSTLSKKTAHAPRRKSMIVLGIVLIILGLVVASLHILVTIGIVLLAVGIVLAILGGTGRTIAGRRHWW